MASPSPTVFARKYGPKNGTHRSGFTPLEYLFPRQIPDSEKQSIRDREDFQRRELCGFTTRELAQLDVISDRELKKGNLENCIHPLLARDRWENEPPQPSFTRDYLYPLHNENGLWSSDNPDVWRVLEPCLKLASRFLVSMHALPWFDALIRGERRPIPQERCPPGKSPDGLFSYHTAPSMDPDMTALIRDQIFESLRTRWNLRFCFMSSDEDPRGPEVEDSVGGEYAFTVTNDDEMKYDQESNPVWRIFIFIEYSGLESLMRSDLTSADRLLLEWEVANTVVHEVMHAVAIPLDFNIWKRKEHYFELTPLSEIGYDFEVSVFGGRTFPMTSEPGYLPLAYWLETKYPCYTDVKSKSPHTITLVGPAPFDYQIRYPVPVTFYQDQQQEEFWNIVVRTFGYGFLHYRSLREGCRVDYQVDFDHKRQRFAWKQASSDRVAGCLPFETRSETFRGHVSELERLLQMTPYQRIGRDFGQAFLRSLREEDAFWTSTTFQEVSVKEIIKQITQVPANKEEKAELLASLAALISEAGKYHEAMIVSIIASEEIEGSTYTDRRRNLLIWNRGTRDFVCKLRRLIDEENEYTAALDKDLLALELCRMKLWSPKHGIDNVADFDEFAELETARDTPQMSRQICTRLLADDGSSIFARCCAEIMICALDCSVLEGWVERRDALTKHIETLSRFQILNIPDWTTCIMQWAQLAEQARGLIVQFCQAPVEQTLE